MNNKQLHLNAVVLLIFYYRVRINLINIYTEINKPEIDTTFLIGEKKLGLNKIGLKFSWEKMLITCGKLSHFSPTSFSVIKETIG